MDPADAAVADHPETRASGPMTRRRRWAWWTGIFIVLVVGVAAWVAWRTYQAYNSLTAAKQSIATGLTFDLNDLTETDVDRLSAIIATVQQDATEARAAVDDPLFRFAAVLPWVGSDLTAVRAIATTVDDLAQEVLPALRTVVDAADPRELRPHDGAIDLAPVVAAAPILQEADDKVQSYLDRLAAVDRSALTRSVGDAVTELSTKLDSLHTMTTAGATLTRLVPPMLGSEGTRRYLVLFQNLAELRSTGGMFGSYAILTADNGKLTVGGQGATQRTIDRFDTPVTELTPEQLQLYTENIATIPMDTNFTPDFPLAARLFSTMYQKQIDPAPLDGVIAIDPVAIAEIMKGFEPIPVDGQTLASDSLVTLLLSDAYTLYPDDRDQVQRDAFLASATSTAFQTLTTTPRDLREVLTGVRKDAEERRILLFSFHQDEQAELSAAGYTGELPAMDAPQAPTFGIFMSDRTYLGSKLAFYLSGGVTLTAAGCAADGTRDVTAAVRLTSDAPTSGLPEHVAGTGPKAYVLTDEFRVYAPTGGTVTAAEFNGAPITLTHGTDLDRSAARFLVDLAPGTTSTITVHFRLPATAADDVAAATVVTPTVVMPPGVHDWDLRAPAFPGCS